MHRYLAASALLFVLGLEPSLAQPSPSRPGQPSPNISATGRMMPPTTGREPASGLRPSTEVEMLKAQKAAEERNKSWDAKMRRTMGTICNGC